MKKEILKWEECKHAAGQYIVRTVDLELTLHHMTFDKEGWYLSTRGNIGFSRLDLNTHDLVSAKSRALCRVKMVASKLFEDANLLFDENLL